MSEGLLDDVRSLTTEMERCAADCDWEAVSELNSARQVALEAMNLRREDIANSGKNKFAFLLQSNIEIEALARSNRSKLQNEWQQLLRGRQATGSYSEIQKEA